MKINIILYIQSEREYLFLGKGENLRVSTKIFVFILQKVASIISRLKFSLLDPFTYIDR
jgi:hypothetical protein